MIWLTIMTIAQEIGWYVSQCLLTFLSWFIPIFVYDTHTKRFLIISIISITSNSASIHINSAAIRLFVPKLVVGNHTMWITALLTFGLKSYESYELNQIRYARIDCNEHKKAIYSWFQGTTHKMACLQMFLYRVHKRSDHVRIRINVMKLFPRYKEYRSNIWNIDNRP